MSRRRGVVNSDDEESSITPGTTAPPPLNPRGRGNRQSTAGPSIHDIPSVAKLSPEQVEQIRLLAKPTDVHKSIMSVITIITDAAVAVEGMESSSENPEMVIDLEESVRRMIDKRQHIQHSDRAIDIASVSSAASEGYIDLLEIYTNQLKQLDSQYDKKNPEDKYARVAEFQDFKRSVWDVNHQNQPAPENWFKNVEDVDDDIVLGQEIRSLKCPITLMRLEKPVRNTKCPHVYSLDAIKELVRHGKGKCQCPVAGCEAQVTMQTIREDRIMARKVREEQAREEERDAEAVGEFMDVTEAMSEIIYESGEIKSE